MLKITYLANSYIYWCIIINNITISVTPTIVRKLIMILDLSKASEPDCIPVFVQTVVSDRITMAFKGSGATHAVALDISKAFDRVWHTGLHKLKSSGI